MLIGTEGVGVRMSASRGRVKLLVSAVPRSATMQGRKSRTITRILPLIEPSQR